MSEQTSVPAAEEKPKDPMTLLGELVASRHAFGVEDWSVAKGELSITCPRTHLVMFLMALRDDPEVAAQSLVDVCGVDTPQDFPERFTVVYQLLSFRHNHRIRVKVKVAEGDHVPSVVSVYPSAGWFERETYDMYGVHFSGHPDLRRILTDYGFDGHPLRKDFPLTGFVELRYDSQEKRVAYGPVELTQDFRTFDFTSPWEGMTGVQLPGDEKATRPWKGWQAVDPVSGSFKESE